MQSITAMKLKETNESKERIDAFLKRIANVLLINASFTDNLGLLNGKMGIAIFFYNYSGYTKNKIYEEYAGELIDEIYEEIRINTPVNFADGLTGIGWGIEYLVRNNFVQADTDEALSEIDSTVYRIRLNTPVLINTGDNFFSYGHYYISRLRGHKIDDEDLNTLIKKYHLIFMIDECERIIIQKHYLKIGIETLNTDQLNSIIWFVAEADRLGIFPFKTKKILDAIPEHIGNVAGNEDPSGTELLLRLGSNIKKDNRDNNATRKKSNTPENDLSEKDLKDFVKRTWQRMVYQDYYSVLKDYSIEKLLQFIENEENWKDRLNNLNKESLSLTGLAGLGLGLLSDINAKAMFLSDSLTFNLEKENVG